MGWPSPPSRTASAHHRQRPESSAEARFTSPIVFCYTSTGCKKVFAGTAYATSVAMATGWREIRKEKKMKNILMAAGVVALAGMMSGCMTSGAAGEDKVAAWQKDRTPVEVLKSKIAVKAAGAVVEALDVAPFGIYKAIADKVDGMAAIDRSRRSYQMYIGTIKELQKQGKSKEEAVKEANAQLDAAENSAQLKADIKAYLAEAQKTNFDACL